MAPSCPFSGALSSAEWEPWHLGGCPRVHSWYLTNAVVQKRSPFPPGRSHFVAVYAPGLLCDRTEASVQPGTRPCSPFLFFALSCCLTFLLEESVPQTNRGDDLGSALGNPTLGILKFYISVFKTPLQQVELTQRL